MRSERTATNNSRSLNLSVNWDASRFGRKQAHHAAETTSAAYPLATKRTTCSSVLTRLMAGHSSSKGSRPNRKAQAMTKTSSNEWCRVPGCRRRMAGDCGTCARHRDMINKRLVAFYTAALEAAMSMAELHLTLRDAAHSGIPFMNRVDRCLLGLIEHWASDCNAFHRLKASRQRREGRENARVLQPPVQRRNHAV